MLAISRSTFMDPVKNKKRLLIMDYNKYLTDYKKSIGHFFKDDTFLTQTISDPTDYIKKKRFKIEIISVFGSNLHFIDTELLNQLLRISFYQMINSKKLDIEFKPSNEVNCEFDNERCERLNYDI